jgi:hypothetical protein
MLWTCLEAYSETSTAESKNCFLYFSHVSADLTDFMSPDRRKVIGEHIIFKNTKRGKVEKITIM